MTRWLQQCSMPGTIASFSMVMESDRICANGSSILSNNNEHWIWIRINFATEYKWVRVQRLHWATIYSASCCIAPISIGRFSIEWKLFGQNHHSQCGERERERKKRRKKKTNKRRTIFSGKFGGVMRHAIRWIDSQVDVQYQSCICILRRGSWQPTNYHPFHF